MKRNEFWSRVFTFVPTATKADGEEIDEKAFRTAIDYQIENGVHGVCIFGSTGGNGSFSDEEMKKATAIAARYMGPDRAEEVGKRNAVPGELLVRLRPTKVIAAFNMTA